MILCLVLVEGAALVAWHRRTGQGIAPRRLLGNLAAGFFLMLAVRLALSPGMDVAIALCLLLSLFAHLGDLALRWRSG